jgi:hypothetical protein
MSIICLAGKAGSGKDTFADVLVKNYNYTRIALADPLRELCSKVFRMDYNLFLDQDKKDNRIPGGRVILDFHHIDKIREYILKEWDYELTNDQRDNIEEWHGEEFDTPRDILRCVGTKLLRHHVSDTIWLDLAMSTIRKTGGKIVVTDCRFENEREMFAKCGALLVLIKRNDDGDSMQHEFNLGSEDSYDVIFDNSGTLNEFQSNVNMWYKLRSNDLEFYKVFKYE